MNNCCHILVVEDDQFIRDSLSELLVEEGYEVQTAREGQEGINALRSDPSCQLVLLDLMMPVKDGFAFRREQLADPKLARVPVIIFSADTSISQPHAEFEGAKLLTKPVDLDVLLDTIAGAVRSTSAG